MYSLIFREFVGRSNARPQAFQAVFGGLGSYGSLAVNRREHAPCELAADLTPEDAAQKAAILRDAGMAIDIVPTAEVRDVKHRARDCWPTHRAVNGETFTDFWGCVVVRGVLLGLREQINAWRKSVPVARFWEFELATNHEHPTNDLNRHALRKAQERGEALRAALRECFPDRPFLLACRGVQVSFCQFTQELALGITPEPYRNARPAALPDGGEGGFHEFCETCEQITVCIARREPDAEFPSARFADCTVCGSEVTLWADWVVELVAIDETARRLPLPEVPSDAWERPLSDVRLPASFADLQAAVRERLHPGEAWSRAAFRRWLGREAEERDGERFRLARTLLQIEELSAMLLTYRIRQLALPTERQDRTPLTPERLGIARSSPLYHPARRALEPVTVVTLISEKMTEYAILNGAEETYSAGRRLDPVRPFYEGRFGYGLLDLRGRTLWTTTPSGERLRIATDLTPHAAKPWSCAPYGAATPHKYVREQGPERCVAFAYLYDEGKRVIAQHRRLFCAFHELNIDPEPKIEMRLIEGFLQLRSDVFVWGVFLRGKPGAELADNAFDLLPGIPYSLPWNEDACGPPAVWRTGNSLFTQSIL